ncbi:hypothetical protein D1007_60939 [Hordeum vulgare]|nr:hypothetical protein D1007_60939 [Hordeum vulgare]
MKREGYQHGAVRVNRNKLLRVAGGRNGDGAALELVAGAAYARAPTKPTNASRDTGGRCRRPRCAGCHQHPPAAAAASTTKARDKAKGARKLRAADVALNHRLVSWRVVGGAGDGPAATGGYNYRGASASAVLAHLAGGNSWHAEDEEDDDDDADLEAAAPRGISDLYDLIVGLQAAPGVQGEDADRTAAADTDEIEEHDAQTTDDVDDEDEEEDDDGFCVVRGITIALEFSDGEEDWIVV